MSSVQTRPLSAAKREKRETTMQTVVVNINKEQFDIYIGRAGSFVVWCDEKLEQPRHRVQIKQTSISPNADGIGWDADDGRIAQVMVTAIPTWGEQTTMRVVTIACRAEKGTH